MKKLFYYAIGQAIAILLTWIFGLLGFVAFLGGICLWYIIGERYLIIEANTGMMAEDRKKCSLQFVASHAINCMSTMVIAASLGLFNGYDILIEEAVGGNFIYENAHQGGWIWWLFFIPFFIRVGLEYYIDKKLQDNRFVYWSE